MDTVMNQMGELFEDFKGPAFEEGEQWRALTKIKVRREPSINAPQLGSKVVEKGEVFVVAEERRAKIPTGDRRRLYLRIAGTNGWVFDTGVAGAWYGRSVAEKVYEDEDEEGGGDGGNPISNLGDTVGKMFR